MPIQEEELQQLVESGLHGAHCRTQDLTGTRDHWALEIEWTGFAGQSLLQQHRAVLDLLRPHMDEGSGVIHAVQIKTIVPTNQA